MSTPDWRSVVAKDYDLSHTDGPIRLYFHPLNQFYHHNLEQLAGWADYLSIEAGLPVCRMVRNREGRYDTEANGESWVLMNPPQQTDRLERSAGATLAELHARTTGVDLAAFPESSVQSKIEHLENRLDALEKKYDVCRNEEQPSSFERVFTEHFPYFSGCAENAIQMAVDESINFPNAEPLCIGHYRFVDYERFPADNPAHWVVDDRSRDLAEGLRALTWQSARSDIEPAAAAFLDDYESFFPLSGPAIGKMYGRLLYPITFIECCERYFNGPANTDERELELVLRQGEEKAKDQERLLSFLADRYKDRFYAPEWLART
ncbi:hypothetical protein NIE88_16235 [Sporolactobacillus shoreicorticis]|uniref:Spore coat protein YutH n=1 Tax=Sporolactobacillus shoreicorticis TaxID=1923877 RepID=A0ABW5S923_9BACL|nr:hypothetical protein [Sporolactobacillus shoreicorticis]MCO7127319.1 hypothetical protein [Sporolactobacillus shoreicorticis]